MFAQVFAIAKREFKAYFISPIAYVYLITFVVLVNWLFFRSFYLIGQADMRSFFALVPWIFLFFVPAVAMGKWSEEKKVGTYELLLTLPIRDEAIVLGKYLAGLALIATALLFTFTLPLSVRLIGFIDFGPVIGGYIGLFLLGGAFLAVGLFASNLTENQIIAFILGVIFCFVLYVIGTPLIGGSSPGFLTKFLQNLGFASHFQSIARGVIDSRDIIYYLSVISLFLYFNWLSIQVKR